jgi:hypothetical protein
MCQADHPQTQSLDKGTLGTSAIMGWQTHVGAVGQDYALTSTMWVPVIFGVEIALTLRLWIGIIIGEPIVNQFVRRLPVAKVLGYSVSRCPPYLLDTAGF